MKTIENDGLKGFDGQSYWSRRTGVREENVLGRFPIAFLGTKRKGGHVAVDCAGVSILPCPTIARTVSLRSRISSPQVLALQIYDCTNFYFISRSDKQVLMNSW